MSENLCLACWPCNLRKGKWISAIDPESKVRIRLFHPVLQGWDEYFCWDAAGLLIVGLMLSGRATVQALNMNDRERVNWPTVMNQRWLASSKVNVSKAELSL